MNDWIVVPCQRGELYESARWVPAARAFQWVDILRGTLHRWSPADPSREVESRDLGLEFATAALPLDAWTSIVASRSSLHQYDWSTNELTELGRWTFSPDVRFNDGAISPDGDVYIGTMSMTRQTDTACLYRFTDGELVVALNGVGISNGLCWVSRSQAYYVDSLLPRIDVLTVVDGSVHREPWVHLDDGDEPDGMTVTQGGTVLAANWGRSSIERISRDGRRQNMPVPVRFPTSVAVSQDESWLLVTSAAYGDSIGIHDGHVLVKRCHGEDDHG